MHEPFQDATDVTILQSIGSSNLKTLVSYPANSPFNVEESIFAYVTDQNGDTRLVKKQSIAWLLESGERRLSNDRLTRVMQTASFIERKKNVVSHPGKQPVHLGDWCLFKNSEETTYYLGRVLSMGSINSYSTKQLATVIYEWDGKKSAVEEEVGAICAWYEFQKNNNNLTGVLKESNLFTYGLHSFKFYICSCPPPYFSSENNELLLPSEVIDLLSTLFDHI